MERMVRLQTSRRVAAGWTQQLVVMDQGPIYTLATLQMRASRPAGGDAFDTWRNHVVQEWAGLLDTVIYLEASDDVLLRRIADRSKPHRLRSCIDADALRWLAQLRDALEQTVERFRACAALSVLRFDTGDQELACIADRIGAELDRRPHRAGRI
jgi:deoxyadenosine/deoxycytidine kinase